MRCARRWATRPYYECAASTTRSGRGPCRSGARGTSGSRRRSRRFAHGMRRPGEGVVVVLGEMLRNLAAGREPDLVVAGDVGECFLEGPDAIGLADEVKMQRNAHHRARLGAFRVQPVELPLEDLAVVPGGDEVHVVDDEVVHLERV